MAYLFAFAGFHLAAVLLLSSALKARQGMSREAAVRSALGVVIRRLSLLVIAWRALVAVEAGLALALLVLPPRAGGTAAAAFFVAAGAYAGVLARVAPDRSCGCFGAGGEPASPLVVVRALLLACVAGIYAVVDPSPARAFGDPRAWSGLLLLVAVTLVVSREWRAPFQRRAAVRRLRNCSRAVVDIASAVELVRTTDAWQTVGGYVVRDDPVETWREGCWELLSFDASVDGKIATVVFALGLAGRRPRCRAMLRRGFTGTTILETPEERLRSPRLGRAPAPPPAPVRA
jgi:hypothetical protein